MSTRNSLVAQSAVLSEPNTRLTEPCLRDAVPTLMTAIIATGVALTVGVFSGSESTATRISQCDVIWMVISRVRAQFAV
jgi:hypothetical protein